MPSYFVQIYNHKTLSSIMSSQNFLTCVPRLKGFNNWSEWQLHICVALAQCRHPSAPVNCTGWTIVHPQNMSGQNQNQQQQQQGQQQGKKKHTCHGKGGSKQGNIAHPEEILTPRVTGSSSTVNFIASITQSLSPPSTHQLINAICNQSNAHPGSSLADRISPHKSPTLHAKERVLKLWDQ